MRCRFVLCSTIQALILASGPIAHGQSAPAQAPGVSERVENGTIYLRGGEALHATAIESVPNVELRVTLPGGETRVVPRTEILYWIGPGSPKAAVAPEPPAEPPLVVPGEPASRVHLGGWSASLQRDTTGRGDWTTICSAPCNRDVPTYGKYRVVDQYVGEGMKASGTFVLRAAPGERESVVVNGASSSAFVAGLLCLTVGAPLSLFSAVVIGLFNVDASGSMTSDMVVAAGAGVVFAAVGTILVLANGSTSVTQSGSQAADERPVARDIFWSPRERAARGPVLNVPLVTARF